MILAMGFAYGGLAQIIVGIMEFKKGNTFGTAAFTSYGLFWWSLVVLLVLPKVSFLTGIDTMGPTTTAMAAYFFMWGIFTFVMFFGTLNKNRGLQFVFGSLAILFFLLVATELTGIAAVKTITGIEGVICGASAVYLALAEILNECHGRTVLPICPVK
jgi:hypothetical protein